MSRAHIFLCIAVLLLSVSADPSAPDAGKASADAGAPAAAGGRYDPLFDLVDLAPKDSVISRGEWNEAAESGVLAIVAGKISSASAAFGVATFNAVGTPQIRRRALISAALVVASSPFRTAVRRPPALYATILHSFASPASLTYFRLL